MRIGSEGFTRATDGTVQQDDTTRFNGRFPDRLVCHRPPPSHFWRQVAVGKTIAAIAPKKSLSRKR
jgi:hypothetical protein